MSEKGTHRGTREFLQYSSLDSNNLYTGPAESDPLPSRPRQRESTIHEDAAPPVDLSIDVRLGVKYLERQLPL